MKKSIAAPSPEAYVACLRGWRRTLVDELRATARLASPADETVKWGHLVYFANGPAFLIRAEAERVLFGFWRGQRLRKIEPRLKAGGKYEMATIELRKGDVISQTTTRRLVKEAIALNKKLGNPTAAAKRS